MKNHLLTTFFVIAFCALSEATQPPQQEGDWKAKVVFDKKRQQKHNLTV